MADKTTINLILQRLEVIERKVNNNNNAVPVQLNEQLKSIVDRLCDIERKIDTANNTNCNATDSEDKERKRSLVLIVLPESTKEKPTERAKEDADMVSDVLDALDVEVCPQMVYRMGRRNDDKRRGPRLVKVVLPRAPFNASLWHNGDDAEMYSAQKTRSGIVCLFDRR